MIVLFCQIKEGMSNSGIVRDELMVEIGKAKKGMYFLEFSGDRPGSDAIEFN